MDLKNINRRTALQGIAGLFGLASAGLMGLEKKANAQVYKTPNGRVAIEGPGYIREHWEEIHPGTLNPEYNGRKLIDYNGIKIRILDESSIRIEDRSKQGLVPLLSTRGFFSIKPGKIAGLEYTDKDIGVIIENSGDLRDPTPAFQLIPHDSEGRRMGNNDVYFCDNHGGIYPTSMELVDDVWHGKRDTYRNYKFDRGNNTVLYFSTKSFACLTPQEKKRFWDKTTLFDQLSLRGAPLDKLKRAAR